MIIESDFRENLKNNYTDELINHMDEVTYVKEYLGFYHREETEHITKFYSWGVYNTYFDAEGVLRGNDGLYIYRNSPERSPLKTSIFGPFSAEELIEGLISYEKYRILKERFTEEIKIEDVICENDIYMKDYMYIPEMEDSKLTEIYRKLYSRMSPASYGMYIRQIGSSVRYDDGCYYVKRSPSIEEGPMSADGAVRFLMEAVWMIRQNAAVDYVDILRERIIRDIKNRPSFAITANQPLKIKLAELYKWNGSSYVAAGVRDDSTCINLNLENKLIFKETIGLEDRSNDRAVSGAGVDYSSFMTLVSGPQWRLSYYELRYFKNEDDWNQLFNDELSEFVAEYKEKLQGDEYYRQLEDNNPNKAIKAERNTYERPAERNSSHDAFPESEAERKRRDNKTRDSIIYGIVLSLVTGAVAIVNAYENARPAAIILPGVVSVATLCLTVALIWITRNERELWNSMFRSVFRFLMFPSGIFGALLLIGVAIRTGSGHEVPLRAYIVMAVCIVIFAGSCIGWKKLSKNGSRKS